MRKHCRLLYQKNLNKTFNIKKILSSSNTLILAPKEYELHNLAPLSKKVYYQHTKKKSLQKNINYNNLLVHGAYNVRRFHKHFFASIKAGKRVILSEDSLLRSIGIHYHKSIDKKYTQPVSFMFDDLGYHFSIHYPTRLELLINSSQPLNQAEHRRACVNIEKITKNHLTKYNNKPINDQYNIPGKNTNKVLLVGQKFNDASVTNSNVDYKTIFADMLKSAIEENPDADIYVSEHSESFRRNFFAFPKIERSNVHYLDPSASILHWINVCQKVYVCSSSVGLEAILRDKDVVVFGAPCYAGWGLSEDRNAIFATEQLKNRRSRRLEKEELFYRIYIDYTVYRLPHSRSMCEIEQAIDYLIDTRRDFFATHCKNSIII